MMVMNIRWGLPNNLMYLYMGGDEAPVWWADYPNLVFGARKAWDYQPVAV